MDSNFLQRFILNSLREWNPQFSVLLPELVRHWHPEFAILDSQSRHLCLNPGFPILASSPPTGNNQQEITVFRQVVRDLHLLLIRAITNRIQQSIEALKGTVNHLQRLLCNIRVEKFVVLIAFALVIVPLVLEMFTLLKEVLPHRVQPYVVEVFTQSAQRLQSGVFRLAQIFDLILLGQKHQLFWLYSQYISENG